MLGFKINNEFLDLPSDVAMELQRNNPFLNTDETQGEYSMPITFRYTEKNYRLINYLGNFYKESKKVSIDTDAYDNGVYKYGGKLVLNQHTGNINNIEDTVWTGFFTMGSASFFQEIKDKKLQDINYGGIRTFAWTGYVAGGFWEHIGQALVPRAFPYTFAPIYNPGWAPEHGINFMNNFGDSGFRNIPAVLNSTMQNSNAITIAPQIYLDYILTRIFAQFGWKLAGEIVTDPGYLAATIPSFKAIDWIGYFKLIDGYHYSAPLANISFDLADHVPPDVNVGQFLVNLQNRFGWYFDYDSSNKIAYLRANKNLINATPKNWTKYVLSSYNNDYQDNTKIFSLVNNIDSNDTYPLLPVIDYNTLTSVLNFAALPDPNTTAADTIIYSFVENNFYQNQFNGNNYSWVVYAHNVGDYTPLNADTPIESEISTMPLELLEYYTGHSALFPACNQPGNWAQNNATNSWGIRILFYFGMQPDQQGTNYPYASCTNRNTQNMVMPIPWALPYKHNFGAANDGTYEYWFKEWLKLLAIQDTRTMQLDLPITELKKFSFSDMIVINNVWFLIQSFKEVLPYQGRIEARMKRIY